MKKRIIAVMIAFVMAFTVAPISVFAHDVGNTSYDHDNDYNNGYDNDHDNGYDNDHDNGYDNDYDNGYDNGYDNDYDDGYDNGYDNDYDNGYDNDYDNGYDNDYDDGYDNGYDDDYDNGYDDGYDNDYDNDYDNYAYDDHDVIPEALDYRLEYYDSENYIQGLLEWEELLRGIGMDPHDQGLSARDFHNVIDMGDVGIARFGFEPFSAEPAARYNTLIVDVSGSMGSNTAPGSPMVVARESVRSFVRAAIDAPGTNYVAIVAFSNVASVRIPFTRAIDGNRTILYTAVDGLLSGGTTNIVGGLNVAMQQLLDTIDPMQPHITSNVLLLSDGLPNVGSTAEQGPFAAGTQWRHANAVYHAARQIAQRGHQMYSLAFFHNVTGASLQFGRDLFMPRLSSWWPGDYSYPVHAPGNLGGWIGRQDLEPQWPYIPRPRGFYIIERVEDLQFVFDEIIDQIFAVPIIVIPGIAGSSLAQNSEDGTVVWMSAYEAVPGRLGSRIPRLALNTDGSSVNTIVPRSGVYGVADARGELPFGFNWQANQLLVYGNMMQQLRARFGNDMVHFFAYDWRLDNAENARLLRDFVYDLGVPRVDIVAHSMGGLIASYYIADGHGDRIRTIVTLGTPFLGSARVPYIFATGRLVDFYVDVNPPLVSRMRVNIASLAAPDIRRISSHMPSAYQLLPYRYAHNYIARETGRSGFLWRNRHREYVPNTHAFIRDELDMINTNSNTVPANVRQNFLNMSPAFMNRLFNGNQHVIESVNHFAVVGYNRPTIQTTIFDVGGLFVSDLAFVVGAGDGTVNLSSATLNGRLNARYFRHGHTAMVYQPDVISYVISRIAQIAPGDPGVRGSLASVIIRIESPVDVEIRRGNEVLNRYNTYTDFGVVYFLGENLDKKIFALVGEDNFDVEITGTGVGYMTYNIRFYDSEGQFAREEAFGDVPITYDTLIRTNTNRNVPTVLLIDTGDGQVETMAATERELATVMPPTPPTPPPTAPPVVQPPTISQRTTTRRTRTPVARRRLTTVTAPVAAADEQEDPEPVETAAPVQGQTIEAGVDQVTLIVTAENLADGTLPVSVSGLPEAVIVAEEVEVSSNIFELLLSNLFELPVGSYELIISINGEEIVFLLAVTDAAPTAPIVTPVEPQPIADTPAISLRLVVGDVIFTQNDITRVSDAAPFIDPVYNRTMVPLRVIAEAFDAQVTWVAETRTVTIVRGVTTLSLHVDSALPGGMGMPAIVNDRTFVPIAYVSEMLGFNVRWDGNAQAVYVYDR